MTEYQAKAVKSMALYWDEIRTRDDKSEMAAIARQELAQICRVLPAFAILTAVQDSALKTLSKP